MSEFMVTGTGSQPGSTRVELDGHDVTESLTAVDVHLNGIGLPHVTLHLDVAGIFGIHAEAAVEVSAATRALLARLGWTAPA